MEPVLHEVGTEESRSLTKHYFPYAVDLSSTVVNLKGGWRMRMRMMTALSAPQTRPEYEWLVEHLGPCALGEEPTGVRKYDFYPNRNWTVLAQTYYFRDEKDAALFKLFWMR
jgi:hypothetical protein